MISQISTYLRSDPFTGPLIQPGLVLTVMQESRRMPKAIYTLKLSWLQHQFSDFNWQKKLKVEKMVLFIVFAFLESCFRSPFLLKAASNDLNLYSYLQKFSKVH